LRTRGLYANLPLGTAGFDTAEWGRNGAQPANFVETPTAAVISRNSRRLISLLIAHPEGFVYPDSRCYSVIFVEQPAKSIDASDCAVTPIRGGGSWLRRLEGQAAVRSFFVVMPEVLSKSPSQMALPEDQ
jgi:hypothetical protein